MGMQVSAMQVNVTALADGTTLEASGGKLQIKALGVDTAQIKNDAVGIAKLNADIVGIATATGKINSINSTNFTSLDRVNLTNVRSFKKLGQTTLGSNAGDCSVDSLVFTGYTRALIVWSGKNTTAEGVLYLRFNDDGGTNYDFSTVQSSADSHGTTANATSMNVAYNSAEQGGGFMLVDVEASLVKSVAFNGGESAKGLIGHGVWDITPEAITKVTLTPDANQLATGFKITVYGIED